MEWEREEGWTDLDEGGVAWAGIRRGDIGECLGPTPKGPRTESCLAEDDGPRNQAYTQLLTERGHPLPLAQRCAALAPAPAA